MATYTCSFCTKDRKDVFRLIQGPEVTVPTAFGARKVNVYICDECVELCVEIIAEDRAKIAQTEREKRHAYLLAHRKKVWKSRRPGREQAPVDQLIDEDAVARASMRSSERP